VRFNLFIREGITLHRKIIILLGFIVLSAAFAIAGCKSKTVEQLFTEGVQQLQSGNPGGAIVLLKNALEKDRNHIEARFQLAKAYAAAGKPEQAEKEFQKVLRQNPGREEIKLELAKVHILSKKPETAIEEAGDYLKSHPGSPEALEILGAAHFASNNTGEAESCLLQALQIAPERKSSKIELAAIFASQRKNREAKGLLNEVIAKDPKDSRTLYMLAALETAEGNRDKALEIYSKLTQLYPSDSTAQYKSALIHFDKGETEKSSIIARDIIAKYPKRGDGYRLRGIVSFYNKKYAEAITDLQHSVKVQPTVEGLYFLGLSLYSKGELENALSQFRIIIDHNPNFIQARLLTAMILLTQKRVDDSIAEISRILRMDDKNALAHNLLGSAYMAKGLYDEGLKELNRATELDPKLVEAHLRKGVFKLSKGNVREAETDLQTAVNVRPELLNSRLILFSHYMRRNDHGKALSTLQQGISGKKEDAVLYNSMAAVMFSENKPADALNYLRKAKVTDPSFLAPYFNTAIFHASSGAYDKALLEYGDVLRKEPKNIQAILGTAATLELKGKENEALNWYNRGRDTNNQLAYLALANYHMRKKEPGKAVSVLDAAIKAIPRNADLLEMKGRLYLSEKRFREAIQVFDDLESLAPDRGIPLKINTYVAMKEIPKAVDHARRIITLKPNSSYGYVILASIYESQNDFDRAIVELKNGMNREKDSLQALLKLGNLYIRKRDYQQASTAFAEAVRKSPDSAPAHFSQGSLLEMTGKKREAVSKYRQALSKSENYLPALNNLAYLYSEGYGDRKEGLRMAITAFKQEPGNGGVMDTLGYALLKNGRAAEARKVLEKAASNLSDNPTVHYHLALACLESGDKSRAAAALRKALQLGSFQEEKDAKSLLAQMK
jgi:putative PEP-CTERM system TPR-repeat lipoprotein